MICESCGKQIMDGSAFCIHCGARTNSSSAQPSSPSTTLLGGTVSVTNPNTSIPHSPIYRNPPKPWYRSTGCMVLAFLFCIPVWQLLIFTDKDAERWLKIVAAVFLVLQIVSCIAFIILSAYGSILTQYYQ